MIAKMNRNYVPAYWDDFFNDSFFNNPTYKKCSNQSPSVNVVEDDKSFRIEVAVPGLSRKDIQIDLENDILRISSEQKEGNDDQKPNYMRREFNFRTFNRSFQMPETVDQENIRASHEDGVLSIELPKKEEEVQKAPKQIEIK